jgi:starch phosphorylase
MEPLQPALPERLARLNDLAYDLWWTWNPLAREVFKRLDHALWRQTAHNPVLMLFLMPPESLERASQDDRWLELFDRAVAAFDTARTDRNTLWTSRMGEDATRAIAYFSAEFALHQSLPIYAGGLGVLAGDHCKEASDLGLPLVGVGFMYPQGYFKQRISPEGWQQEDYVRLDWSDAPVSPAMTPSGHPCIVAVPLGNRTVLAQVWRIRMGRVTLLLLDTDLEENAPWDRELSARLYGGDRETRIQQEVILGIGGVRVLRAMGYDPAAWHLNEGHAAFVVLQRIREHIEQGQSFDEALAEVRKTTVFTTHTPVAAGHDAFPFQLVEQHLAGCWGDRAEVVALRKGTVALSGQGPSDATPRNRLRSCGTPAAHEVCRRDAVPTKTAVPSLAGDDDALLAGKAPLVALWRSARSQSRDAQAPDVQGSRSAKGVGRTSRSGHASVRRSSWRCGFPGSADDASCRQARIEPHPASARFLDEVFDGVMLCSPEFGCSAARRRSPAAARPAHGHAVRRPQGVLEGWLAGKE